MKQGEITIVIEKGILNKWAAKMAALFGMPNLRFKKIHCISSKLKGNK